ncbi:MAG: type III-B CRISPR-associated protein Cas10/Cmr2 [bacterium]|nr:type III-B CRISPR-associated protein Cas10/Cmr2 [bacterium]
MKQRLDFSIGPVQGFISQSRRTRDLWGSSYLLAFLSAHAICGARWAGAGIVQPLVDDDPLVRRVCGEDTDRPPLGTVPNHFVVETITDPRAVATATEGALQGAWNRVCRAVWESFVAPVAGAGNGTEAIWKRQVSAFWEVTWTAGPATDYADLRARRKHWRSYRPPDEPGDKCTVMHDLQELSGYVRVREARRQDRFWDLIGQRLGRFDLRENERLCAVALVKRLFPKVAQPALGWTIDTLSWPSTVYLGAVPWIRRVVAAAPDAAKDYAEMVQICAPEGVIRRSPPFGGLATGEAGDFPRLEANYMHRRDVLNENLCPLEDDADRQWLAGALRSIYSEKDERGRLGPPSTFYALLLADGDRLGKLVATVGGEIASRALASFNRQVPEITSTYDGVTVYAGGDDVLAMLPVDRALQCADELSRAYSSSFAGSGGEADRATLSAAVVFAHVRMPLSVALAEAHQLLDDVAKDGNGRSSLAVGVLKPGGRYCRWVSTWARRHGDTDRRAVEMLRHLVDALGSEDGEPGLSSALVYRIRELLALLCGWDRWEVGSWGRVPDGLDLGALLYAEVSHSLAVRMESGSAERAETLADRVVSLLFRAPNTRSGDTSGRFPYDGHGRVAEAGVDALLLARFLADPDDREPDR